MKEIQTRNENISYKGCRFYFDDIEKILSLFHERNYLVEITDNESEYDSLTDLKNEQGETPCSIIIRGKKENQLFEWVSINIDRKSAYVSLSFGRDDSTKIIFEEIKKMCELRNSKYFSQIFSVAFGLMVILLIVSLKTKNGIMTLIGVGICLLASIYEIYFRFRKPLILRKKHEGGFWKKNQDRILIGIISSAFGALIGAVIMYLLTKSK